jgi:hypothetical protein
MSLRPKLQRCRWLLQTELNVLSAIRPQSVATTATTSLGM